ncbi:uncharacterized protein AMSG_00101 [Thecamonas trahens ATCC 50062]|uniref:Uncharacterized protein n=1 Tax=Thecamonas trahens ATCC 50062 TaxID=461836 RepID=A0A0L0D0S8_THETB|nr:hypothetical protein AMSG_00101 [Thecamonas trahens ATCC 50062]KNC45984.1 hypothetical protein AMSG_00101 [Thecamonas trahens ATCC 50062]|eukprot:XP_013762965.1 hypothetical protein AMSG_00101 [Thecamonas trahens ATCC 50062]
MASVAATLGYSQSSAGAQFWSEPLRTYGVFASTDGDDDEWIALIRAMAAAGITGPLGPTGDIGVELVWDEGEELAHAFDGGPLCVAAMAMLAGAVNLGIELLDAEAPGTVAGQVLAAAAAVDEPHLVHRLMEEGVDPSAGWDAALRCAARRGYAGVVAALIVDERVDPSRCSSEVLRSAARAGHTDVVYHLLADGRVDANAMDGIARASAVRGGHDQVVALLDRAATHG